MTFSADDVHMFAVTLNALLQALIPIISAAGGAWVMHIGHNSGSANARASADGDVSPKG